MKLSQFESATTLLTMAQPTRPGIPMEESEGGLEFSAAGIPSGFVIQEFSDLGLVLRFTEAEWPNVRAFVRSVQTGQPFAFRPDTLDATEYTCYLVSPVVKERIAPTRGQFPGDMELSIVIRSAVGTFDVRYFG